MLSTKTNRGRLSLIAGLLVAALGITGTIVLRNSPSNTGPTASGPGGGNVAVVAATADIAAGTKISADQLTVESLPSGAVPAGYSSTTASIVGQYAAVAIRSKQIILADVLVSNSIPTTAGPASSAFALKDGDVALTLPDDKLLGEGFYIQPGDHIDIMIDTTGGGTLKYAFQDILVLRVGTAAEGAAGGGQSTMMIVEVPRRQGEQLALIADGKWSPMSIVRYALRPRDQYGKGYLDSGPDTPYTKAPQDGAVTPQALQALFQ